MPKDVDGPSINGLAVKALDDAGGDWEKGAAIFRKWVDDDPDLRAALLEPFLEKGIWRAIRRAAREQRKPGRKGNPLDGNKGIEAMAETMAEVYFDYPLVGGVKLGDATISKLEFERDMHQTFATSNRIKAKRFQLIIDVMVKKRANRDKTVRDLMSHDKLLELWEEAKNE